ncbi:MAG: MoaD/ThiS family protein [Clostridia bacterium]
MEIKIKLFAYFRDDRGKILTKNYPAGATPANVAVDLGIDQELVAILLVNGVHAKWNQALAAGDTISLFPPVAGG